MIWLYTAVEYIVSYIESLVLFFAFGLFFERRMGKKATVILCCLLAVIVTAATSLLNSISLFAYFTAVLWMLISSLLSLIIYKVGLLRSAAISVLYTVMILAFDFLVVSVMELLIGEENFTLTIMSEVGPVRTLYILFQKVVLILVYLIIYRHNKGRLINLGSKTSVILIVSGGFCFFSMQYLINAVTVGDIAEIKKSVLLAWLYMILFFFGMITIASGNSKMENERAEKEIIYAKTETLEKDNIRLNNMYKEISKLTHDFTNNMRIVASLARNNKQDELLSYISGITGEIKAVRLTVYTGNELVDAVLNNKSAEADEKKVPVAIKANYPADAAVESVDICALLINMIDNAIEAASKTDCGKRFVNISISSINKIVLIKVENSVCEDKLQKDGTGNYVSTKSDRTKHGYGNRIISAIAKKYDGTLEQKCENKVFSSTVLLNNYN